MEAVVDTVHEGVTMVNSALVARQGGHLLDAGSIGTTVEVVIYTAVITLTSKVAAHEVIPIPGLSGIQVKVVANTTILNAG